MSALTKVDQSSQNGLVGGTASNMYTACNMFLRFGFVCAMWMCVNNQNVGMVSHAYVMLAQEGEARDVLHGQTMKTITNYQVPAEKNQLTRVENNYFTNVIKAVLGTNFHDILDHATAMYCPEPYDEPTS